MIDARHEQAGGPTRRFDSEVTKIYDINDLFARLEARREAAAAKKLSPKKKEEEEEGTNKMPQQLS